MKKNPYIKMCSFWIQFEICDRKNISNRRILNILKAIKLHEPLPNCRTGYTFLDKQLERVGFFIWDFYILNDYSRIFYNERILHPEYCRITKKRFKEMLDEDLKVIQEKKRDIEQLQYKLASKK